MNRRVAIAASLFIHLALAYGLSRLPQFRPAPPRPFVLELQSPTEQERQDARKELEKGLKQVVRQTEVPERMKTARDRPARFYSERDQAVLEETRATISGLTQNRSSEASAGRSGGVPGLEAKQKPSKSARAEEKKRVGGRKRPQINLMPEPNFGGLGDVAQGATTQSQDSEDQERPVGSRPLRFPNLSRLGGLERGESTVGETLPEDIKFGSFTSLNTDRYVHYSFYARFEELFRHRWVKYVRAALFSYQNGARVARGDENWTTRLEIVLDRDGHFKRGILHEGSGFKALDAAPVEAMQEIPQVPNVPSEMVRSDQTVRLMYEFNVQFVPQYAAGGGGPG